MAKEGVVKKAERWETHHKIAAFAIILIGAIILTRLGVWIHYPGHLYLEDVQLHHFDYGILMLIIGSQLSLFGPKKYNSLYFIVIAIATGLILDEYWMIRHGVTHAATPMAEYNSTIPSASIFSTVGILMALFIGSVVSRKKKHKK